MNQRHFEYGSVITTSTNTPPYFLKSFVSLQPYNFRQLHDSIAQCVQPTWRQLLGGNMLEEGADVDSEYMRE